MQGRCLFVEAHQEEHRCCQFSIQNIVAIMTDIFDILLQAPVQ
jgi:hypothetical protein